MNAQKKIKLLEKEIEKLKAQHEQYGRESIKWSAEDFIERAKDTGYTITRKQAQSALEDMIREHDCNNGISWVTLDVYIQLNGKEKK